MPEFRIELSPLNSALPKVLSVVLSVKINDGGIMLNKKYCSEAALRRQIVAAITRRWPRAWIYCPADRWKSGIPDLLICVEGKFLAIEVKTPIGRVAPIQDATLSKIRRAGGSAWVIRAIQELDHVYLP